MPVIDSTAFSPTDAIPDDTPQTNENASRLTAPDRTRILSVSTELEDHKMLRDILDGLPVLISTATSCQEALEFLRNDPECLVFCDHLMKDGTWRDVLNQSLIGTEPPLMVVTSRLADEYLWAEVLNLGGWDVLAKPFRAQEVLHVVDTAWIHKANPVPRTRVAGVA